jgi:hypothetical protein
MSINHFYLMIFCSLFFSVTTIFAQEPDSHEASALDCLLAMHINQTVDKSVTPIFEGMLKNSPDLVQYHDVLWNFFDKHICWDHLKDYYIKKYCEKFSKSELQDMTSFFKTKTGQKFIEAMPELQSIYSEISQKIIQDNLDELSEIIQKKNN